MLLNIGLAAYIIGTITLVVTKGDEATSTRRQYMKTLSDFIDVHQLGKRAAAAADAAHGAGGGGGAHHLLHHLHHRSDAHLVDDMKSHMELFVEFEAVRTPRLPPACRRRQSVATYTQHPQVHSLPHPPLPIVARRP
jgi:hypothetical protein